MVSSDPIVAPCSGVVHGKINAAPFSKRIAAAPEMGDGRDRTFPPRRGASLS
jgi:hypothetical protein